jgi:Flp pilus assembly protein TadB
MLLVLHRKEMEENMGLRLENEKLMTENALWRCHHHQAVQDYEEMKRLYEEMKRINEENTKGKVTHIPSAITVLRKCAMKIQRQWRLHRQDKGKGKGKRADIAIILVVVLVLLLLIAWLMISDLVSVVVFFQTTSKPNRYILITNYNHILPHIQNNLPNMIKAMIVAAATHIQRKWRDHRASTHNKDGEVTEDTVGKGKGKQ